MTTSYQQWPSGCYPSTNISFATIALDASGEKLAHIFCAEESDTITDLFFRYGARTGTPPEYKISLQALDGSGNPDGTVLGGGSPASKLYTPPADTTWNATGRWITLDNTIAITKGTMYAIVNEYSSGTIDGSNNSTFEYQNSNYWQREGTPYATFHNGTSWSRQVPGSFAYRSATRVYGFPVINTAGSSASTNGHRTTAKITIPTAWCSTYKVRGLRWRGDSAASADFKVGIWDTAGSVIQDVTFDADHVANASNTQRGHEHYFDESSLTALNAGTAYHFGIERTTQTVSLYNWTLQEANDRMPFPFDTNICLSTWNGSAWSDTTTSLPWLELLLADVTAPSGGGGGVIGVIGE